MTARIFVMAALLPYVSLAVRFPAEVQPWAACLGWSITLRIWWKSDISLRRAEVMLLMLAVLLASYVSADSSGGLNGYLTKSMAYLFSVGIYFAAKDLSYRATRSAVSLAAVAYLLFGLVQVLDEDQYRRLTSVFVPVRNVVIGERGVASLAPEATDFGLTAVFVAVFGLLLRLSAPTRRDSKIAQLIVAGGVCLALLSRSGTGIVGGVLVAAAAVAPSLLKAVRRFDSTRLVQISVGLLSVGSAVAFADVRGARLLRSALTSPAELLDTTFVYRFIHNEIAVRSLLRSSGRGFGGGSFGAVAPEIYVEEGLAASYRLNDYYSVSVPASLEGEAAGVIPQLLLEYGIAGLAIVVVVVVIGWSSPPALRWPVLMVLWLTWMQSFPPAYPPFWLLLGLASSAVPRWIADRETLARVRQAIPSGRWPEPPTAGRPRSSSINSMRTTQAGN